MDHVAIMNKSWKLIPKILTGEKTVESRWYINRIAPWDKVKRGDLVYFKNSSQSITAQARVGQVVQFSDINSKSVKWNIDKILNTYGREIAFSSASYQKFAKDNKNKNYCILIFLENPRMVGPFNINKTGFGNACAWLCVPDINQVKS